MPRPQPEASTSFISKPARGWLHSDLLITKEGITYAVRYIGCLEVNTSMKSLDFDTRSQVAKECINRVCEAAGLKTTDKKRKVDKRVQRAIGERPIMDHAGANVNLTVSSSSLILTTLESGKVIAKHEMPRISFASGGDTDTLDFVAYVAKDLQEWRACYVLECGGGLAQDVINTVGQAFELRFKQFLQHTPTFVAGRERGDEIDYYNDLPGKVPPDVGPPPVPPLPACHHHTLINIPPPESVTATGSSNTGHIPDGTVKETGTKDVNNLIDLDSEPVTTTASSVTITSSAVTTKRDHDYVNDIVVNNQGVQFSMPTDVFDLKLLNNEINKTSSITSQREQLLKEVWFHGFVSRQEAESLLTEDGEFLVRESQGSAGQYVLTGMQGGVKKHLLLIDPEGVVRTKDRMFESISHLINYHCENQLPIISAESALVLRYPVHRTSKR